MNTRTAIRDGAIIAGCLIILRFVISGITGWRAYSWAEIGCLYLFAKVLNLGESALVHFLAPFTCFTLAGAVLGGIASVVPGVNTLRPRNFRLVLAVFLLLLLLISILILQVDGWI